MTRDPASGFALLARPAVSRGAETLRRLLCDQTFDLRAVDPAGFGSWLEAHLLRWRRDPIFVQRARIRDLRAGCEALQLLEKEQRRLTRLDAASAAFPRLHELERERTGTEQAIAGLSAAAKATAGSKRVAISAKLKDFRSRHRLFKAESAALTRSSPQRQELLRADRKLRRLRAALGLDAEETKLAGLLKERGRRGGRAGNSFEQETEELIRTEVLPELLRRFRPEGAERTHMLRRVTLGAAQIEFDLLVVRQTTSAKPVDVLAAVEAKRNLNDLAHGFRRRQRDLGWLTGEAPQQDPAAFRAKTFPTGRFDRLAFHEQDGGAFAFDQRSFRRFRRDPASGAFLDRVYFVTRAGLLWGLSSAALSRLSHRIATDHRLNLANEVDLRAILDWSRSLCEPFETPDLLRLYASRPEWARQILVTADTPK